MAITLRDYIFNCYSSRGGTYNFFRYRGWDTRDLAKSAAFTKFIKVPLIEDIIEVPCIYKYPVMEALSFNLHNPDKADEAIYIPMMCLHEDNSESRSSNPLLRKFLYDTYGEMNLSKKKGAGTVYFGGEGIILYEDFTPLIMLTMQLKKDESGKQYIPWKQILRVSPIIYSRDDLLAKNIRTKFLQGVLNMKLTEEELSMLGYYSRRMRLKNPYGILTTTKVDFDFRVIIEDFSDFFYTPKAPDITFNSKQINHLLLDNSEFFDSLTL